MSKQNDSSPKQRRFPVEVEPVWFLILHLSLFFYSLSGVCAKMAGRAGNTTNQRILWFALELFIIGMYAIVWQQILKHMTLTFASVNMPVAVIYRLLWSWLIFHETITPKMIIGSLVILIGITIGVSDNGN